MKTKILDAVESKSIKENIPHFEIGDTVDVKCRIKEGDRERIQMFTGTVISRKGRGVSETCAEGHLGAGVRRTFIVFKARYTF